MRNDLGDDGGVVDATYVERITVVIVRTFILFCGVM